MAPPAKQDFYHHHDDLRETVAYDRAFQVVGAGQTIFFASSADDKVYALDARTGRTRWMFFTEGPVRFAPCVADGRSMSARTTGVPTASRRKMESSSGNTMPPSRTA